MPPGAASLSCPPASFRSGDPMTPARPPHLAAALSLLLAACAPASSDARLAEQELLAREVIAAWEAGDLDALTGHFWPDAVYDDFPNAITYQGLEEIAAYKAEVHEWASDVTVNVTAVHPSPTGAVAEWVLYGVEAAADAPLGQRASDREVLLNGVTIFEVEGGLVVRAADYLDTLPFVLQLGGRVVMPDGEVRELAGG